MISKEDIENLGVLARLKLSEEEATSLQKDISDILEYVGQVSTLAPEEIEKKVPLHHNVMRDDVLRVPAQEDTLLGKEEALRAAFPKHAHDYNIVRKIIQKDE